MKKAFHVVIEGWLERIPDSFIALIGFLIAVTPVLVVSGWFYVSGY